MITQQLNKSQNVLQLALVPCRHPLVLWTLPSRRWVLLPNSDQCPEKKHPRKLNMSPSKIFNIPTSLCGSFTVKFVLSLKHKGKCLQLTLRNRPYCRRPPCFKWWFSLRAVWSWRIHKGYEVLDNCEKKKENVGINSVDHCSSWVALVNPCCLIFEKYKLQSKGRVKRNVWVCDK